MDQFVFVRIVKANDIDLTLFQFDYDLTFSVFFMNADRTIYGRYGSRSSIEDATQEMSIQGLAKSMDAALAIHGSYPSNRSTLEGKQSHETKYKTPDELPALSGQFKKTPDYQGAVTKSCMHCHQIRDAQRQIFRDAGDPISDRLLFPNPSPGVIGWTLDPSEVATVTQVQPKSIASRSGFLRGDRIVLLDGQAIVSVADIQWVLDSAPNKGELVATIEREENRIELTLNLTRRWRTKGDISWRVSSWPLRRMGTGGLLLVEASSDQRASAGVDDDKMALVVKHVGQFGPHAAAKRAGFRKGDLVLSFDGNSDRWTPSELLAYSVQKTKPGQKISVSVVRKGKTHRLELPMQR